MAWTVNRLARRVHFRLAMPKPTRCITLSFALLASVLAAGCLDEDERFSTIDRNARGCASDDELQCEISFGTWDSESCTCSYLRAEEGARTPPPLPDHCTTSPTPQTPPPDLGDLTEWDDGCPDNSYLDPFTHQCEVEPDFMCDPLTQNCPGVGPDMGCYVSVFSGASECRSAVDAPFADEPGLEGDECSTLNACAPGLACDGGRCARYCSLSGCGPTCGANLTCLPIDFPPDLAQADYDDVGLCADCNDPLVGINAAVSCGAACDVLDQDCSQSPGDELATACYLSLSTGHASCAAESPDGVSGIQGEPCSYANSCAEGYGCAQLDDPVQTTGTVCALLCDASDSGGPGCADGPGDQLTCVAINGGYYGDATNVAPDLGMCVDCTVWADVPGCQ